MSPLYRMMHRWKAEPFEWGHRDCALSLADFYEALHGIDPAAHLRGTYHDAASCQRRCGWFTHPVAVIQGCLDGKTAERTEGKKPGVVAVIQLQEAARLVPVGAVWLGTVWGCRGFDGVTTVSEAGTRPLAMWDIGYEA